MTLSDEYRRLAALIDVLESQGLTVREAAPADTETGDGSPAGQFTVRLEVDLPERSLLDRLADDDVAVVEGSDDTDADESTDGSDGAQSSDTTDGGSEADGGAGDSGAEASGNADSTEAVADDVVLCTHPDCNRTFESERGMKIHRTKAHPLSELIDPTARGAIHHDPEALAEVYEEYETFAEMTEALDVDVGAQAVRKQMIRHGIHEPEGQDATVTSSRDADRSASSTDSSAATNGSVHGASNGATDGSTDAATNGASNGATDGAADADDTSDRVDPEVTADADSSASNGESGDEVDGADESDDDEPEATREIEPERLADRLPELDLPGSLSTTELLSAVESANTLYDVQRDLGLSSETTRDVLAEYDLLELVTGRAASAHDREEMKSEIHERLRRAAT